MMFLVASGSGAFVVASSWELGAESIDATSGFVGTFEGCVSNKSDSGGAT